MSRTEELENDIAQPDSFATKLKASKRQGPTVEVYGGEVPKTMDDLLTLGGVARKTANVVLGNAFDIASGVVVDTHVGRLSQRLGLTKNQTAEKIEQDLIALVPKKPG